MSIKQLQLLLKKQIFSVKILKMYPHKITLLKFLILRSESKINISAKCTTLHHRFEFPPDTSMFPPSCNTPLCRALITDFLTRFLPHWPLFPLPHLPTLIPELHPHGAPTSLRYSVAYHTHSCLCPFNTVPTMSPVHPPSSPA